MINTDVEITAEFWERWLTVSQLKEILDQLEEDDSIFPNKVGNLTIMKDDTMTGYIDFGEEKYIAV